MISHVTVGNYLNRFATAGLSWPLPPEMSDGQITRRLFLADDLLNRRGRCPTGDDVPRAASHKHVTLQLLWQEYREAHPEGYGYTQFVEHYRRWEKRLHPRLRQDHRAGERMFVDFAGATIPISDPRHRRDPASVSVRRYTRASNYTYAEATATRAAHWIGVARSGLPILRRGPRVDRAGQPEDRRERPCLYEPELNPTYQERAEALRHGGHAGPGQKAAGQGEGRIRGTYRRTVDHGGAAAPHVLLHHGGESGRAGTARQVQQPPVPQVAVDPGPTLREVDRPALKPLPERPYRIGNRKKVRVHPDYHVEIDRHYYSVPYLLIHRTARSAHDRQRRWN